MNKVFSMSLMVAIVVSSVPGVTFAGQPRNSILRTIWENPYTLTSYRQNNEVNSTFFTFPKVIWNGSQYVDYVLNSSDMSAGIGSVYLKVCPDYTVFYDPYKKEERIQKEAWTVEYYDVSNANWIIDSPTKYSIRSLINSSGIYFDRTTTLSSGGNIDEWYWLRIGSSLKISVVLHPILSGQHRLVWLLSEISATKAQWLATIENISTHLVSDRHCNRVQFADENESKCNVDWSDAGFFNMTTQKWNTYFQEVDLQEDASDSRCQAKVSFGDFQMASGSIFILDPTVQTFNSTQGCDGFIERYGPDYPPQEGTAINNASDTIIVGVEGKTYGGNNYHQCRGYVSFDTSSVPALAYNISPTLKLRPSGFDSSENFTLQVWGGIQPIYNNNLNADSWGAGSVQIATWNTVNYQYGVYVNLSIPSDQINKVKHTEFELRSSVEETTPGPVAKYVYFYSGNSMGNEPKLEVSYCLDAVTIQEETWFYRNVSTTKVAIVIFGGTFSGANSIDYYPGEKEQGKIAFLDAIIQNGSSVFTPSHGSYYQDFSIYNSSSTWVQDLTIWLYDNQSYRKVCLFGFSAGGMIVENEIQKDYASRFCAAIINSGADNFNNVQTAYDAKVATSFIISVSDNNINNTEMKAYYDNTLVQKEWHNWTGNHGEQFRGLNCQWHTCSWSSGENISTAVLTWFNAAHPPSAPSTPSGPQLGFAHNTFNYTSRGFQSDGGNLTYQFDWNDGTTTTVGTYVSGTNVTCSHCWTAVPTGQYDTYYNVTARVRDASQNWSVNSTALLVHIKLDDGGCGGDAGDTFGNASTYNSGCSLGTLVTYPYLTDEEDWYKFQANSGHTITMDETHLDQFWIWLELYNPSGTLVASSHNNGSSPQYISYTANTNGWWRARIFVYCNMGHLYTFHISVAAGGGGGGCPYVYDWNGSSYVKDNNILPASETGNGTDTKDSYKLEQQLVPLLQTRQASLYTLQIREFENEHDYIDQVRLTAVDHSQNTSVAVTPEGEIVTYQNPTSPLSCVDNNGDSQLVKIRNMDGNVSDSATYFQGCQGDWLLLDFGNVTSPTANLILRDDWKCDDVCIEVQIPSGNGGWRTVEVLHPRNFWAIEAVNMSAYLPANGNLLVRLFWTSTHRLDYVGLDTSAPAQTTITTVSPALAIHSTTGDVTGKLLHDDENCVELVNGQHITMVFILPNEAQDTTRDFVLYTNGYYYTITQ